MTSYPYNIEIWSAGNPPPNGVNTWYVNGGGGNQATGYPEDWPWSPRIATGLETNANGNVDGTEISNMWWESLTQGNWYSGWQLSSSDHATVLVAGPDSGAGGAANVCGYWVSPYSDFAAYQNLGAGCNGDTTQAVPAGLSNPSPRPPAPSEGTPPDDAQLHSIATAEAAILGDSTPSNIVRVTGVSEQRVISTLAQEGPMSGAATRSVDVITESGNFNGSMIPTPADSPTLTGTQLTLVIDQHTGEVIGIGLGHAPPALSQLGATASLG